MYRPFALVVVLVMLCAAALAGAGLAQRPVDPTAPGDLLYGRVLGPGELSGFYAITCPAVTRGAERWAAESSLSATDLVADGFVAGLREQLLSKASQARAASLAVLFRSPAGARREVEAEAEGARASANRFSAFGVTGIPGARGYLLTGESGFLVTVSFSIGRLQYAVRIATTAPGQVDTMRERALAAAGAQYRRLRAS